MSLVAFSIARTSKVRVPHVVRSKRVTVARKPATVSRRWYADHMDEREHAMEDLHVRQHEANMKAREKADKEKVCGNTSHLDSHHPEEGRRQEGQEGKEEG